MAESFDIVVNLAEPNEKARLMAQIGAMQGVWRVEAKRHRPRRSDRQNRWYWPCFVGAFAQLLKEEGNEYPDFEEAAHGLFKRFFLSSHWTDKHGERHYFVRSTGKLNTFEFNEYLDRCAAFLADYGITVPVPDLYHEKPTKKELEHVNAAA